MIDKGQPVRVNRKRLLQILTVGMAAVGAPIVIGAASAGASVHLMRVGSIAPLPRDARLLGALPSAQKLRLTIALQPQDPSGLQAFATAVATPGSPGFRHYLTVDQFAHRFGATPAQIDAVQSALRAQGMAVGTPTANDLTLPVTGTAAEVDSAMSAQLARVQLASGRTTYANLSAPTLPSTIAGYVQGVIGLDDVAVPEPAGLVQTTPGDATPASRRFHALSAHSTPHVLTGGPQPCGTATTTGQGPPDGVGYTADELAAAYQFSGLYQVGDLGAGQTVGVIEFGGFNPSDVGQYQGCFVTTATVNPVNVDGGPGPFNPGTDNDGESALDIETVIGLAPKATVDVYQAPDTAVSQVDMLTTAASQNVAKVISDSNGLCEAITPASVVAAEGTALQEAAAQGQSFFDSSGDSGSEQCSQVGMGKPGWSAALGVLDPASQPFATGVGGTTLFKVVNGQDSPDTDGSPPSESVWNDGTNTECACGGQQASGSNGGGGGGGLSRNAAMPSYQSGAAASLGVFGPDSGGANFCGQPMCREVPDVSADASALTGYVVFTNGSWGIAGGTSAATPLWAAFAALTNADPACRGLPIGFANPALYQIGGSAFAANFHDVSTLPSPFSNVTNNDTLDQWGATGGTQNPTNLYPSTTGYDMATGLGSMIAPALASSLCSLRAPVYTVAVTSPGAQTSTVGHPVSLQVTGADSGGAALSYSATGLPAGLSISPTGLISGTPTTAEPTTVTVAAADPFTNAGSTSFTWTVVNPPPPPPPAGRPTTKSVKLAGLGKRKPKLTFTVGAGSNAPALKSVSVSLPNGFSFAKKTKSLDKGIAVRAGGRKVKFAVRVRGGVLTITFKSAVRSASLTLGTPAITVSGGEASKIRKHKIKKLTVNLRATDTSNKTVKFAITLKKLS
jgi:subtilase family serine protease